VVDCSLSLGGLLQRQSFCENAVFTDLYNLSGQCGWANKFVANASSHSAGRFGVDRISSDAVGLD